VRIIPVTSDKEKQAAGERQRQNRCMWYVKPCRRYNVSAMDMFILVDRGL